jgi:hypothetical protein
MKEHDIVGTRHICMRAYGTSKNDAETEEKFFICPPPPFEIHMHVVHEVRAPGGITEDS